MEKNRSNGDADELHFPGVESEDQVDNFGIDRAIKLDWGII